MHIELVKLSSLPPGSTFWNSKKTVQSRVLRHFKDQNTSAVIAIDGDVSSRAIVTKDCEVYAESISGVTSTPADRPLITQSTMGDKRASRMLRRGQFSFFTQRDKTVKPEFFTKDSQPEEYDWDADDVAMFYGVTLQLIRWRARHGQLPKAVKVGHRLMFRSSEIRLFTLSPEPIEKYRLPEGPRDPDRFAGTLPTGSLTDGIVEIVESVEDVKAEEIEAFDDSVAQSLKDMGFEDED